jgi:hypothetical protein
MLSIASNSNCFDKVLDNYIGGSRHSANTRINEHIYNINYFKTFSLKETGFSYHFNLQNQISVQKIDIFL